MLPVILDVHPVERAQDAHQAHDVAEDVAEGVHAPKDQCPVEEVDLAEFAAGHGENPGEQQDRDEQQVSLLKARGHQQEQEAAQDQDERRMEPEATHAFAPPAWRTAHPRSSPRGS